MKARKIILILAILAALLGLALLGWPTLFGAGAPAAPAGPVSEETAVSEAGAGEAVAPEAGAGEAVTPEAGTEEPAEAAGTLDTAGSAEEPEETDEAEPADISVSAEPEEAETEPKAAETEAETEEPEPEEAEAEPEEEKSAVAEEAVEDSAETEDSTETEDSAEPEDTDPAGIVTLNYGNPENWAYFAEGEEKDVDVFLICPLVDTRSERNAYDLNAKLKARFVAALDAERGIYDETGRMFAPYYRQMALNAYTLPENERQEAKAVAYQDVSAAFRWYLEHENNGRGVILAGFSQGAEMCLELMKEYYGGDSEEAQALRERLVEVYAIGWVVTEEMTEEYPQIVPASGELDTGTVVSYDCEDGSLNETLIIPLGTKALSINPLNWATDSTPADASLNLGAVLGTGAEPIPEFCGACLGERGELIVSGVSVDDFPPGLSIFPEGAFHLYDCMFFYTNLKNNVQARTAAWLEAQT